jgi:hypothetical protein
MTVFVAQLLSFEPTGQRAKPGLQGAGWTQAPPTQVGTTFSEPSAQLAPQAPQCRASVPRTSVQTDPFCPVQQSGVFGSHGPAVPQAHCPSRQASALLPQARQLSPQ